jgi:YD repeat-containing protein
LILLGVAQRGSETTPEAGTITYTYDNASNLHTKTAPAPNQTGSNTVTTTYTYDALNRLTQKSYSDGTTISAFFAYDSGGGWGVPQTNAAGRLAEAWTGTSCCVTAGAEIFGYDPVGRVVLNTQYTPTMSFATTSYTYDLAGNMTSYTNPASYTFT